MKGAKEKACKKKSTEKNFTACARRQGLRALDLRELFEKSSAKTFILDCANIESRRKSSRRADCAAAAFGLFGLFRCVTFVPHRAARASAGAPRFPVFLISDQLDSKCRKHTRHHGSDCDGTNVISKPRPHRNCLLFLNISPCFPFASDGKDVPRERSSAPAPESPRSATRY